MRYTVRATGLALASLSLATLAWIFAAFDGLLIRHLKDAETLSATLTTLQTWASEVWLETDFIGPGETALAWVGLVGLVVGVTVAIRPEVVHGVVGRVRGYPS